MRNLLYAANDLGKKWVGYIGHQGHDDVRSSRAQHPRLRIRGVSQPIDGRLDPAAC